MYRVNQVATTVAKEELKMEKSFNKLIDEYNKKAKELIDLRNGLTSHFKEVFQYKLDRIYW